MIRGPAFWIGNALGSWVFLAIVLYAPQLWTVVAAWFGAASSSGIAVAFVIHRLQSRPDRFSDLHYRLDRVCAGFSELRTAVLNTRTRKSEKRRTRARRK